MGIVGFDNLPRYGNLVARAFGEDVDLLPQGVVLEQAPPEYEFLKNSLLYAVQAIQAAGGAGQFSEVGIRNKSTIAAPRILVVTHIGILSGGVVETFAGVMVAGPAGSEGNSAKARDSRWPGVTNPPGRTQSVVVTNTEGATSITSDEFITNQALYPLQQVPPKVLGPGATLWVFHNVANLSLRAGFAGYERPARPEEIVQ